MSKYSRTRHGGGGIPDNAPPGAILYKDNRGRWRYLGPGTSSYVLKTNGPGAPPTWAPVVVGSGGSAHVIENEGTPLSQRTNLDFHGTLVDVTDDAINDKTIVSIISSAHVVQNEGTSLSQRSKLDFHGASVDVTDDSVNDKTIVTVISSAHTILEETTPLTQRSKLAFQGTGVVATDDAGNDQTIITIAGGSGVDLTPYHAVSAASTNATAVSSTARKLGMIACYNNNASPRYLKIFDRASAPTLGTHTPILTLEIPGNSTNGAGNNLPLPNPIGLTNGLAYALTTGNGDADTGAVAAGDIIVNLGYA
jgi:hypothetical protein